MNIESKLVLASKSAVTGVNLYTFVLTYPRVILAEVNTHRVLSRNTASSRAIPAKKQRERVLTDPFVPVTIGQNQRGMQAGKELEGWRHWVAVNTWKAARYPNVFASWVLDKVGAQFHQASPRFGIRQGGLHFAVDKRDDVLGRACGRYDTEPGGGIETRHAQFPEGRHIGEHRGTARCRQRDGPDRALVDLGRDVEQRGEEQLHAAAQ